MNRRCLLLAVPFLFTGSAVLAGEVMGKPAPEPDLESPPEPVRVVVAKGHAFIPAEITVKVGTRIRWENQEKRQYHSVFFQQLGDKPGDYFFPGESRERVFDTPGSFPYICEPHWQSHGMKGVVHVLE